MKVTPISAIYSFQDYRMTYFRRDEKIFSDLVKSHMKKAHRTPHDVLA